MTTAIIGSGGIGSAVARRLASGGETLRLSSVDVDSARRLAAEIGSTAVVAVDNRDAFGRRVVDGAVRSVRPSHLVKVGIPRGISLGSVDQTAPVLLVDRHLVGQQELGAQQGGLRAERKHGRDAWASPIPPAATTGTGATESTTAGTSGSVATPLHTCPPASILAQR